MPWSEREFDELKRAIRLALISTTLNDWERNFLNEIQLKLEKQGSNLSLSDKQHERIFQIIKKHSTNAKRKLFASEQGSRSARAEETGYRRHAGSLTSFRAVQLPLVAIVGGIILAYFAIERFPEFLGPVVSVSSITQVVGTVTRVRDGDTIEVAGVPIRIGSLDCAESGTAEGSRATERMRALASRRTLTCYLNGRTSYDRKIGSCRLDDGRDLGGIMISEGLCSRFW
jgi:endonuclease YncB( thermonuclease family)